MSIFMRLSQQYYLHIFVICFSGIWDSAMDKETIQKLRRRIEDYLRKYASAEQLLMIARLLSIKEN